MIADAINNQLQLYLYILLGLIESDNPLFTPDTSDLLKKHLAFRHRQIKQGRQRVCPTHIITLYLSICFNVSCRSMSLMVRNNKTPDHPFLNCQLIVEQLRNLSVLLCALASVFDSQFGRKFNSEQINPRGHRSFFSFCCSIVSWGSELVQGRCQWHKWGMKASGAYYWRHRATLSD